MRFGLVLGLCVLATFGAVPGSASAAPVPFTLVGVTFDDGGTASGSFTYDAATNTFGAVDITTTTGSSRTGATYNFICVLPCDGVEPAPDFVLLLTTNSASDQSGLPGFALGFLTSLGGNDVGSGKARLVGGQEATCSNATCTAPSLPSRFVSGGQVVDAGPIPTLSEWGTIVLVLGLLTVGMWQLAGRPALRRRQM